MSAEPAYELEAAPARQRFDVLESLRGVLAVTVILYHLNAATHFAVYFRNAYVAVDFFFVLSGFVIASVYQDRISRAGDFVRFSVRRFGRLYPLHIFMLLIWLGIEFAKVRGGWSAGFADDTSWPAFWSNLFLIQGFNQYAITWNYPAWSISVELWTNLLAGLILLAFGRRWRLGAVVAIACLAAFFFSGEWVDWGGMGPAVEMLANRADYMISFFTGMLTFAVYQFAKRRGLGAFWGLDFLAVALAVAVFRFGPDLPPLTKSLAFAAVVLIFAFEKGLVSALLRRRFFLRLGTVSYSIYLSHALYVWLVTEAVYAVAERTGQAVTAEGSEIMTFGGPWVLDAIALGLVVIVVLSSIVTYRFVEDPARRFFYRLTR